MSKKNSGIQSDFEDVGHPYQTSGPRSASEYGDPKSDDGGGIALTRSIADEYGGCPYGSDKPRSASDYYVDQYRAEQRKLEREM